MYKFCVDICFHFLGWNSGSFGNGCVCLSFLPYLCTKILDTHFQRAGNCNGVLEHTLEPAEVGSGRYLLGMPPRHYFRNLFLEDSSLQRVLQCPAWRVKAWLLLGAGQEIRQGLWTPSPHLLALCFQYDAPIPRPGIPVARERLFSCWGWEGWLPWVPTGFGGPPTFYFAPSRYPTWGCPIRLNPWWFYGVNHTGAQLPPCSLSTWPPLCVYFPASELHLACLPSCLPHPHSFTPFSLATPFSLLRLSS